MPARFLLAVVFFVLCTTITAICCAQTHISSEETVTATIAKWKYNHKAALSITSDTSASAEHSRSIQSLVSNKGLTLSHEFTGEYVGSKLLSYIYSDYFTRGFQFFGHGYTHENHDTYTYEESLINFSKCYQIMDRLGFKPVAYAYPGGRGYRTSTAAALRASGFLAGRMFGMGNGASDYYIMPGDMKEPQDWMRLPSLIMQDYAFAHNKRNVVNDNAALLPYLYGTLDAKAWLILSYHQIGKTGYSFYSLDEFEKDLDFISKEDFWVASMNDITLYAYERARTTVQVNTSKSNSQNITFILSDNLNNDYFDYPLTVILQLSTEYINKAYLLIHDGTVLEQGVFSSNVAQIQALPDEKPYIISIAQ